MKTESRPRSPHLQVYRLPLLAYLSISHRITGVLLTGAACLLPLYLGIIAFWPQHYDILHGALASWPGQVCLFVVSVCLVYHMVSGIRHLIWDIGFNLEVRAAERSGYVAIVVTIALTAVIWFIACTQIYGGAS